MSSHGTYSLSTARAGSKSVINKNIMTIKDKPLYLHNLLESLQTPEIDGTYISTNIPLVIEDAPKYGYQVIQRPEHLCQDASTHTDTIKHGLEEIEKHVQHPIEFLVVMLGNTMNMDRHIVKQALDRLKNDPQLDSVVTVIKANHFNPIRAYIQQPNQSEQLLTTFLSQEQIKELNSKQHLSDKNSAGNIYFQNGLWILRRQTVIDSNGILPFPWFGTKISYLEQDPRLQEIDDEYQIRLLS